jgi:uncharacterized glyoxalase superfamily protein PhnB
MASVRPIPDGFRTVTPHLVIKDAAMAIDWYKKAFGAEEVRVTAGPGGKIMHAEIRIGDSIVMLADEFPGMNQSPQTLNGSPVSLHIYSDNVDAAFKRAVDAGAKVTMPLMDQFWGDRYGMLTDPHGHHWSLGMHKEDVPPEEMEKRMQEAMKHMGKC